jgi:beclin 1-associated autophagy-related key regulator
MGEYLLPFEIKIFECQTIQIVQIYRSSDYFTSDMIEPKFTRRVAKLNANILYLCYTQKIKLKKLQPNHTLANIQNILNTEMCDLGRMGWVDTNDCLAESVDSLLVQDLETGDDSESDDENNFPPEWENVTNSPALVEQQLQQQHLHHVVAGGVTAAVNQQSNMALMTSAAASIASFWRGWTGK